MILHPLLEFVVCDEPSKGLMRQTNEERNINGHKEFNMVRLSQHP